MKKTYYLGKTGSMRFHVPSVTAMSFWPVSLTILLAKPDTCRKKLRSRLDVADQQPEGGIYIIPVKLEECDVPDRLNSWHWVNLEDASGYQRLLAALMRRADDLGISVPSSVNPTSNNLYEEEETLEADTHMTFPCELEVGEKINIDLRADQSLDVLIMDEGDYKHWDEKGEVDTLYKEYLDRDQLHTFFTAPDSDTYLVIVRNNSNESVEMSLEIAYSD